MELSFRSQVEPSFVIVRIPLSLYLCLSLKFVSLSVKSVMSVICWCRRSYPSPLWACAKACMVHVGLGRVGEGPEALITHHRLSTVNSAPRFSTSQDAFRTVSRQQAVPFGFTAPVQLPCPTIAVQLLPSSCSRRSLQAVICPVCPFCSYWC